MSDSDRLRPSGQPRGPREARRVLVTGAGGVLGRNVVEALRRRGVAVRGLGRAAAPPALKDAWTQADLVTGRDLDAALSGIDAVVHCASRPTRPGDDLRSIDTLLSALAGSRAHLVHVGIAGVEAAASSFAYYRVKLECERRISASGAPHTIVRATQFHPFVDDVLRRLTLGSLLFLPSMRLAPVDVGFVADRLATAALGADHGRAPDVCGPESLDARALAGPWLDARGLKRLVVPAPPLGPLGALAKITPVGGEAGGLSWTDWLAGRDADQKPYAKRR